MVAILLRNLGVPNFLRIPTLKKKRKKRRSDFCISRLFKKLTSVMTRVFVPVWVSQNPRKILPYFYVASTSLDRCPIRPTPFCKMSLSLKVHGGWGVGQDKANPKIIKPRFRPVRLSRMPGASMLPVRSILPVPMGVDCQVRNCDSFPGSDVGWFRYMCLFWALPALVQIYVFAPCFPYLEQVFPGVPLPLPCGYFLIVVA